MYKDIKDIVKRVLMACPQIDDVEFVSMSANDIRHNIDYDYRGGDRGGNNDEILKVYYRDDLCAMPRYVLNWVWVRPDELVNSLEI